MFVHRRVTFTMESSINVHNHQGFIQVLVVHFKHAFCRLALARVCKIFDAHAPVT